MIPAPLSRVCDSVEVRLVGDGGGKGADDLIERFARYALASGRLLQAKPLDKDLLLRELQTESDRTVVLWDRSARIPPKEVELLTDGLRGNEWRVGVRSGLTFLDLWRPDRGPLAVAASAGAFQPFGTALSAAPADRWIALLARMLGRAGRPVTKVPLMWKRGNEA